VAEINCRYCGSKRVLNTHSLLALVAGGYEVYCLDCTVSYCVPLGEEEILPLSECKEEQKFLEGK